MNDIQKDILTDLSDRYETSSTTLARLISHAEDFTYENVTTNHRIKIYDKLIAVAAAKESEEAN